MKKRIVLISVIICLIVLPITVFAVSDLIGDVSGDGKVDAYDAALILQYDAGLIPAFPAESGENAQTLPPVVDDDLPVPNSDYPEPAIVTPRPSGDTPLDKQEPIINIPDGLSGQAYLMQQGILVCLKNEMDYPARIDLQYIFHNFVGDTIHGWGDATNPCVPSNGWFFDWFDYQDIDGTWEIAISCSKASQKYVDAYDSLNISTDTDRYGTVRMTSGSQYVDSAKVTVVFFDSNNTPVCVSRVYLAGPINRGDDYAEFESLVEDYDHYEISYNIMHATFD